MQRLVVIALIAVATHASTLPISAQTVDNPYNIIAPEPGTRQPKPYEPWLAPKYKSPRGTQQHVRHPRTERPSVQAYPQTPPPLYVPQTGRLVPNLPALPGAGPGGAETGQDRALRCQHQAGALGGDATGNPSAYVGACINQ